MLPTGARVAEKQALKGCTQCVKDAAAVVALLIAVL
jgi:hypothetical protein